MKQARIFICSTHQPCELNGYVHEVEDEVIGLKIYDGDNADRASHELRRLLDDEDGPTPQRR